MPRSGISLRGEKVGIFAMDPGRTTGIAAGMVTLEGSTEEIFSRDSLDVFEVDCNDQRFPEPLCELTGSREIASEYLEYSSQWPIYDQVVPANIFFVYEDFVLNRNPRSWAREGLSPVRVTSLVMGLLVKYHVNYVPQQASQAKSRWTNDRLKRAGLWTKGLEHGRDATRHAALWVVNQMQ